MHCWPNEPRARGTMSIPCQWLAPTPLTLRRRRGHEEPLPYARDAHQLEPVRLAPPVAHRRCQCAAGVVTTCATWPHRHARRVSWRIIHWGEARERDAASAGRSSLALCSAPHNRVADPRRWSTVARLQSIGRTSVQARHRGRPRYPASIPCTSAVIAIAAD